MVQGGNVVLLVLSGISHFLVRWHFLLALHTKIWTSWTYTNKKHRKSNSQTQKFKGPGSHTHTHQQKTLTLKIEALRCTHTFKIFFGIHSQTQHTHTHTHTLRQLCLHVRKLWRNHKPKQAQENRQILRYDQLDYLHSHKRQIGPEVIAQRPRANRNRTEVTRRSKSFHPWKRIRTTWDPRRTYMGSWVHCRFILMKWIHLGTK